MFSERGDNVTLSVSYETLQLCGANDCPANNLSANENLKKPEKSQVTLHVLKAFIVESYCIWLHVAKSQYRVTEEA